MRQLILVLIGILLAGLCHGDTKQDLPKEILVNGVEFVLVPGGNFYYQYLNRNPKTGDARGPAREIKAWVDTYYIGKYEARARDFVRFMASGASQYARQYAGPDNPTSSADNGELGGCSVRRADDGNYFLVNPDEDLPATHLSWDLANEFAQWMGFRLPTDAEWVRAFRGDDKRIYPWGNEYPDDTFAGFQEGATECNVRPVTAFPKGRSPYGAYNMAGNVFEYVADWLNPYYQDTLKNGVRNPVATEPYIGPNFEYPRRLLRGGRWASNTGEISINGNITFRRADQAFRCYGARFALSADKAQELLAAGVAQAVR